MNCFQYSVRELCRRSKIYTIIYIAFSYLAIITSVLQLVFTQVLINLFTDYKSELVKQIMWYIIALIVILYVDGLLSSFRGISVTHLVENGIYEDENIILTKSCKLSIIDLDSPEVKDLRDNAKRISIFNTVSGYIDFSVAVIKTIVYAILISFYKCYLLLPIILIGFFIKSSLQGKGNNKIEQLERKQTESNRVRNYLYNLLINRDTMQEIKLYGNSEYLNQKRNNIYRENYAERLKVVKENELKQFAISSIIAICNIATLCLLVILCRWHNISVGVYVLLMQIVTQLFGLVPSISQGYGMVKTLRLQFEKYTEYLKLSECTSDLSDECEKSYEKLGVHLTNVSFTYPDSKKKAINEINIDIKPGERVAFVGENGSGKSTLVKIILGIYVPEEGKIEWYDKNGSLNKIFNSKIKVVFQDFIKLLRPICENVAMGNIKKINNKTEISELIIKVSNADLAEKIDEYIGPEFGGIDLSGGQWQKLSIARSYIKEGVFAVFDEATSALDARAEFQQLQSFFEQGLDITSIIVTHRLSVTKLVDKIYVINDGKIVECGSHDEIYSNNGLYKKMYDAQSSFYA